MGAELGEYRRLRSRPGEVDDRPRHVEGRAVEREPGGPRARPTPAQFRWSIRGMKPWPQSIAHLHSQSDIRSLTDSRRIL